ncbi:hypothetical protein CDL12_25833 [Handroanthus impetiginosus]|uniref:ZF-HD dimerization-type domain-containing protein n=1 Tax=Handroanthus impetiginosus TaxID=429701 RepID=A0A2G9G8M8_9LAMI|nr:hypothetical protein CDL12_25833 [Handroanthus impetiginosus]
MDRQGHMVSHNPTINQLENTNDVTFKKITVRYKECLKNHAASMGGNATDGCGEFMPNGEEGSLEALTCSVCNCHRNFHRKQLEGENSPLSSSLNNYYNPRIGGTKLFVGQSQNGLMGSMYHNGSSRAIMSYELEDQQGRFRQPQMVKKRFRTKFTQEQKEKMFSFAEKVGWKLQKQEESVVQQFCQEIGVKRRVLKVWMHNNKHNLAKKNHSVQPNSDNQVERLSS